MTVTVTATLASSNPNVLTAPKLGDTLEYRVAITGDDDAVHVASGPVDVTMPGGTMQTLTPLQTWDFTLSAIENAKAPIVTGVLSQAFTQDTANPLHWSAVI